jgi:hypothetical protein
VGAGEILYFALGARGWLPAPIPPSEASEPVHSDPLYRQATVLKVLAEDFFVPRPHEPAMAETLQTQLPELIGYKIPSRSIAAGLLGMNCLGLVVAGWWCGRRSRLDWLAWILPVAAVATTAAFLVIGRWNSRSIPPTVAFTQLVRVYPTTGKAAVSGMAAMYQQATTPWQISSAPGGFIRPVGKAMDGSVARLIWNDDDRGEWRNVSLPGGSVQFATFQQSLSLQPPFEAIARFGPEGIEGRYTTGTLGPPTDMVIANPPAPPLAVQLRQDGSFVARPDDVLPAGQFIADQLLSDAGRRHQDVYRKLLDPTDDTGFPQGPTLLGWSPAITSGLGFPEPSRLAGSAVFGVPLRFERTARGQPFTVPATMIRIQLAVNKSGQSMTYNARTGEWIKAVATASQSRLRFGLPPQVLPCQLTRATLTIKLNAPSRTLSVATIRGEEDQVFQRVDNPNGVYTFVLDQPDQLVLDAEGCLLLTIAVSESEQEREARSRFAGPRRSAAKAPGEEAFSRDDTDMQSSFSTWQIDYARLAVQGITQ